MATITKQPNGKWRAQVRRGSVSLSSVHSTKTAAKAWATLKEAAIESGTLEEPKPKSTTTLGEVLTRYAAEVSVGKKGRRWEEIRIAAFQRELLSGVPISDLSAEHLSEWRDGRLKTVSPSTVNRELALISSVLNHARTEWRMIDRNPVPEIKRPKNPRPRDRRISDGEIAAIVDALGFDGVMAHNKKQQIAVAFLFALETAMRKGEILGLRWSDIVGRSATLGDTKNGDKRQVPLSSRALALLDALPREDGNCFSIGLGSCDAMFRKAVAEAGIDGLHFHDSRHEALTRLAGKLSVLELARMVGHRDPRSLMIYFNATAEELADKLG